MEFAALILAATVALGALLAARMLAESPPVPRIALVHGGIGAVGLILLWRVMGEAARKATPAFAPFPRLAAVLFAAALLVGLAFLLFRRRPPGALVAFHAALAITAAVVLAAFLIGAG